jgi:hypothetical protein
MAAAARAVGGPHLSSRAGTGRSAPRRRSRAPARPPARPPRPQKNGEKKLRALLTRTPEWCSSTARDAAAEALADAAPVLAAALRTRQCSRLTKADLFALAAHWRYASDLWRARGNRPARPLPAPPQAAAAPLPLPQQRQPSQQLRADADADTAESAGEAPQSAPDAAADARRAVQPWQPPPHAAAAAAAAPGRELGGGALHPDAVWCHIGTRLRPLSAAVGRALAGPAARAEAARDAATARLFAQELPTLQGLEAECGSRCARRRRCSRARSAPAASLTRPAPRAARSWVPLIAHYGGAVRMKELEARPARGGPAQSRVRRPRHPCPPRVPAADAARRCAAAPPATSCRPTRPPPAPRCARRRRRLTP